MHDVTVVLAGKISYILQNCIFNNKNCITTFTSSVGCKLIAMIKINVGVRLPEKTDISVKAFIHGSPTFSYSSYLVQVLKTGTLHDIELVICVYNFRLQDQIKLRFMRQISKILQPHFLFNVSS